MMIMIILTQILDDKVSLLVVHNLGVLVRNAFAPSDGVAPHQDLVWARRFPHDRNTVVTRLGSQNTRGVRDNTLVKITLECWGVKPAGGGARAVHRQCRDSHLILFPFLQTRYCVQPPASVCRHSLSPVASRNSLSRFPPLQFISRQHSVLRLLGRRLPSN